MDIPVLECVTKGVTLHLFPATFNGKKDTAKSFQFFVIPESCRASIVSRLPAIRDLVPRKEAEDLWRAFRKLKNEQTGIARRGYLSAVRARGSIQKVIAKLQDTGRRVTCFLAIPDAIYTELQDSSKKERFNDSSPTGEKNSNLKLFIRALNDDDPPPPFLSAMYVGEADCVRLVRQLIWHARKHVHPILIQGDTGTGKEIVANCVHQCRFPASAPRPFKPVNCSAIQSSLFESELFGHVEGSFTDGKRNRQGLWKSAQNGTLFLDEIGELKAQCQGKILRALEESKIRPVGADKDENVHAHVITATNRDLYAMVQNGSFREDLYYRLRVWRIPTPALRDHIEDVPVLANVLWERITGKKGVKLATQVTDCLCEYSWPGNVRELKTVLASMNACFGAKVDSRSQVELAMALVGQPVEDLYRRGRKKADNGARVAAFVKQTRKAEDAIVGARALLEQMAANQRSAQSHVAGPSDALMHAHRELLSICQNPLSFGSTEAFNAVHELSGALGKHIISLESATHQIANSVTSRDLVKKIDSVRKQLAGHVAQLLREVRS